MTQHNSLRDPDAFAWHGSNAFTSSSMQEPGKLSKAQRKNLKRAEKKASERSTEKLSIASSEILSEADLTGVEFDAAGISVIEEESIYASLQEDCVQVC